jgi:hypothetical protein
MVRVWVNDDDFGTMSERAANLFTEQSNAMCPEAKVRLEVVADNAPVFLPREERDKEIHYFGMDCGAPVKTRVSLIWRTVTCHMCWKLQRAYAGK